MKLPRKIKIGTLTYRVTDDPAELLTISGAADTDLFGQCDHRTLTMSIDGRQAPAQQRVTVTHESLHGITDLLGLSTEWGEKEEEIVNRLAPAVLAWLRDNPKLVAYLTAGA